MATRTNYENSSEVGVFVKLTNSYCLVSSSGSHSFLQSFENELKNDIPVISTSFCQTKIIGRLSAGNSKGLIVPSSITEQELKEVRESLPESVQVKCVEERLSALGNVIVANDHVALVHPDLDHETEEAVADTLGVEVFRTTIANHPLVGSYCCLSNQGGLVHPLTTVAELDELSTLLQLPLCAGTVNRGSDVIGSGLVANDWSAFCGLETTSTELSVIDAIFKLTETGSNIFASEKRNQLLDQLM